MIFFDESVSQCKAQTCRFTTRPLLARLSSLVFQLLQLLQESSQPALATDAACTSFQKHVAFRHFAPCGSTIAQCMICAIDRDAAVFMARTCCERNNTHFNSRKSVRASKNQKNILKVNSWSRAHNIVYKSM